jgi:urea transport system ATP-binding protein
VHVSFDGFKAINGLNLDIAPGELRCIIGPNGAGKTTMMDIITGKTRPDSGTVFFGSTIDLLRYRSPRSPPWALAASSRSPRCSSSSRVREPGAGAQDPQGHCLLHVFKLSGAQKDRIAEVLHTIHLAGSVTRQAGCSVTARSSGWRSACCWCRSPSCCCSTSPWPA